MIGDGLDVVGVLAIARYDALVPAGWRSAALLPGARAAVVVGSGGRALWAAVQRAPGGAEGVDPVDRHAARVLARFVAAEEQAGERARVCLGHETREGAFVDLVALGAACGLGAPSRLGLLLHPTYGPWLSLRGLVLTTRSLPETSPLDGFRPCDACPAPCASACPGRAVPQAAGMRFDVRACAATRWREAACALRCDARRACPIGSEHAYAPEAEAHHMRAALAQTGQAGTGG